MTRYQGLIEKYRKYLPVSQNTPIVTLLEGNTPLIFSQNLSDILGKGFEVYLKYEGLNPTGSFKDRGMTLAISKAKEEHSKVVICASTGNTSASAAAYSARAGLKCVVLIPQGAIAIGKLTQAIIHGAKVLAIKGNFDDALNLVKEIAAKYPITLVNSLNPYRIEGQKTGAFEICDTLENAPDYHCIPVGNAGNITAYWKGYKEYQADGKISRLPKMLGFEAAGSAPIVRGRIVKNPKTIATAIRIGNPASWEKAEIARDESGGLIDSVTDAQILRSYKMLASSDGIFAEPASCASVAGLLKLVKKGYFNRITDDGRRTTKIVCILTGHGLKDPDCVAKISKMPKVIKPNLKEVLREVRLLTSLFFCLFLIVAPFFVKDSYSEDMQKGFEEAMKNIEAAKLEQNERVTEELKNKFVLAQQKWLIAEREKRQPYLNKHIQQDWEKSAVSGPYIHQNYYLKDISYDDIRSDIFKTESMVAPYAAVLHVVENLYIDKEHSSSTSDRKDFFYMASTAITVNFEYKNERFVAVSTFYGKVTITKGWPNEVIDKLKLL